MSDTQNITLSFDIGSNEDIGNAIIEAAARRLLADVYVDPDGGEVLRHNGLQQMLSKRIDEAIKDNVKEHVDEHIDAVLAGTFPARDTYGQIQHHLPEQTVAEKIHAELRRELIDRSSNYQLSGRNQGESVLHKVLDEVTHRALENELREEVAAAKKKLANKVQETITAIVAKELAR